MAARTNTQTETAVTETEVETPQPTVARKLRWTFDEGNDRTMAGTVPQYAVTAELAYAITGAEKSWTATVMDKEGNTTTLLEDATYSKAYWACVNHNKARQAPVETTEAA